MPLSFLHYFSITSHLSKYSPLFPPLIPRFPHVPHASSPPLSLVGIKIGMMTSPFTINSLYSKEPLDDRHALGALILFLTSSHHHHSRIIQVYSPLASRTLALRRWCHVYKTSDKSCFLDILFGKVGCDWTCDCVCGR